jgi:hypothetical protein
MKTLRWLTPKYQFRLMINAQSKESENGSDKKYNIIWVGSFIKKLYKTFLRFGI